jgi:hypothetical protein
MSILRTLSCPTRARTPRRLPATLARAAKAAKAAIAIAALASLAPMAATAALLALVPATAATAQEAQPPAEYGPAAYDGYESAEPQPSSAQPPSGYQGAGSQAPQPVAGSYGYLRLVEGSATVTQASTGSTAAAEVNQPILAGDQISVRPRGRIEIVLADHNVLRLDGDTRVRFSRLANSGDRQDPSTEVRLEEGNLQLIVAADSVGRELPTVLTPNASVYIQAFGTYRITAERGDYTSLVVRRGTAEVVSDNSDNTVHADEEAFVDSQRRAGIEVRQAGGFDALERWARQLDDETRVAQSSYVDPSLGYEAAPLERYGHWINVDNQQYWQPNNEDSGWSPYEQGHWDYTPSGQFWVSSEPWGWVPYHYGSWDYLPSYGWAWQPGYAFAPAWVYWYWGPRYVGWCPIGFYTGFYGGAFASFRFGHYGWAGGDWDGFRHWHFCDVGHFYHRDWNRWGWGERRGFPHDRLDRGLITTDARGITPAVIRGNPGNAMRVLAQRPAAGGRTANGLPDVTPFVHRQVSLPPTVAHAVTTPGVAAHLAGTPLAPRTLGQRPAAVARGNLPSGPAGRFNGSDANGLRGFNGTNGRPAPARPRVDPQGGGGNGALGSLGSNNARGWNGSTSGRPAPATPQGTFRGGAAQQVTPQGNFHGVSPQGGFRYGNGADNGRPAPARPPAQQPTPHIQPAQPSQQDKPPQHQQLGIFGQGRSPYQGGTAQGYPAHPAPARPQSWAAPASPYSSTPRYQAAPRNDMTQRYTSPQQYQAAPRYQTSPQVQSPRSYQAAPQYQATPRFQQGPSNQSIPRYQAPQQYQSAPSYQGPSRQSTPQYQAPRYQSAPRYQAPSYQSAPRYQSAPHYSAPSYQSAPRYQAAPHYSQPAPHYSAPRSAPPQHQSSGGGGGNHRNPHGG